MAIIISLRVMVPVVLVNSFCDFLTFNGYFILIIKTKNCYILVESVSFTSKFVAVIKKTCVLIRGKDIVISVKVICYR